MSEKPVIRIEERTTDDPLELSHEAYNVQKLARFERWGFPFGLTIGLLIGTFLGFFMLATILFLGKNLP